MLAEVFKQIEEYRKDFNREKIEKVLSFALSKYSNLNKEPVYPKKTLEIISPLRPDDETILAVILSELYFDKHISDAEITAISSGEKILPLLKQVKKITGYNFEGNGRPAEAEMVRNLFVSMAKDLRVILILLTDKLYRLYAHSEKKNDPEALRLAKESLSLYAPIAARLGIYRMKQEFEDTAFKYTNNYDYENIVSQLKQFGEVRNKAIDVMERKLCEFLSDRGYKVEVKGRLKSIYSIYKKFKEKNINSIDELYDVFAMRVILPSKYDRTGKELVDDLYRVLGLIHSSWSPISTRFKDYVAVPKPNGYRSLHTVILGFSPKNMNQPVEIQIRSADMHEEAQYGIASHWLYKQTEGRFDSRNFSSYIDWLVGLKKKQEDLSKESEVFANMDMDIFKDRIFVLTPRGEVKDLPVDATVIDFAYAVHTDVGNRCVMAKVDDHIVPLDYELKNGQVVEIITRPDATPRLQWLSIVKTNQAANKLKHFFGRFDREKNVKEGKRLLNEYLARINKPPMDQNYSVLKNFGNERLNLERREDIVEEVGRGGKIAADVIRNIFPYQEILSGIGRKKTVNAIKKGSHKAGEKERPLDQQILIGGEADLPVKIPQCCSPKKDDKIIGYVTRGKSVTVHKSSCSLLPSLNKQRFINADWKGNPMSERERYKVKLCITTIKRLGLIRDITSIISSLGMSIVGMNMKKGEAKIHDNNFVVEMSDVSKFDLLMDKLEAIDGVIKVRMMT